MESFQGDLTDIFRPSGGEAHTNINWEFQSQSQSQSDPLSSSHFGDPFCNITDPLLHQPHPAPAPAPAPHNTHQKLFQNQTNKTPCDIFSRIQISHNNPIPNSSSSSSPSPMVSIDTSNTCFIHNSAPLQISSPRNLAIKRRKSQAKKVVCIPAPAAANSRPSGEVVPSDLWAWRKYGQKPIKGSPYPRGYYRCSSSKGCSARKQVERSRTDPNMLVITYTSEHNHPWPTQRNALAGSTRSQPPKTKTKEEEHIMPPAPAPVKQEIEYRPTLPDSNHNQSEDFFADLGEIEPDPLHLLFTQQTKPLDPFTLFDS